MDNATPAVVSMHMIRPAAFLVLLLLFPLAALAQNDLSVIVNLQEQGRRVSVWAYNAGPDVARDVVLFVNVPDALKLVPVGLQPHCDTSRRPVRCTAATLQTVGDTLSFHFRVEAPTADATYTIAAFVSAAGDPNPDNNHASVTLSTRIETDLSVWLTPQVTRAEPGQTAVFKASVHNSTDTAPRDIRVAIEVTNGTLADIEPPPPFTCTISGTSGVCTAPALDPGCRCSGDFQVKVAPAPDRAGGTAVLTMEATSNLPDRFPFPSTATLESYRMIGVTTTADSGPGSLRAAIEEANAACTPGPCKIAFELPAPVPPEGWFTIGLERELPPITAERVHLDGSTQTRLTGDTNPDGPEVAIDGTRALRGLQMYAPCESIVHGLAIGGFTGGDGLRVGGERFCGTRTADRHAVTENFIGLRPDGTAWPNQRGLHLDNVTTAMNVSGNTISRNIWSGIWAWNGSPRIVRNRIEDNGKSGIFLGPQSSHAWIVENTISRQAEMGVAIARGATLYNIQRNSMTANGGLAIDIGLDGRSPVDTDDTDAPSNAPVLLGAHYDAARDRTLVTMRLSTTRLGPYMSSTILDFYLNDGPDGDGEQWLTEMWNFGRTDGEPITLELWGDHRGKWINATSTRAHSAFSRTPGEPRTNYTGEGRWTSELSNAVPVM